MSDSTNTLTNPVDKIETHKPFEIPTFTELAQASLERPLNNVESGAQIPALVNENEFLRDLITYGAPYFGKTEEEIREMLDWARNKFRQIES